MKHATGQTIYTFFALILIQIFGGHTSEACSCHPLEGTIEDAVAEAFDTANEVFLGEIIENGFVDITISGGIIRTVRRVNFRVLQSWKGSVEPTLTVDMPPNCAQCGPVTFDENGQGREPMDGDQFLVYAAPDSQTTLLSTHICLRTSALCSDSGLVDIRVFEQLGIQPLISDGVTVAELEETCSSDQLTNENGACGIGFLSLFLLLAIGVLRASIPAWRCGDDPRRFSRGGTSIDAR